MMMSYTLSIRNNNRARMIRNLTPEQIKMLIDDKKTKKKVTWAKGVKSPRASRVRFHKYLINR
jgi:hypothetical protein